MNEKLIRVLAEPATVEILFEHMLNGPIGVAERPSAQRFPNLACEILNFGIGSVNQTIFEHPELLDKFFGFLQNEPLKLQNAVYFCKITMMLLEHQKAQLYEYVKDRGEIVTALLKNIACPPLAELLLVFIKADQSENIGFIPWLTSRGLLPHVFAELENEENSSAAFQLLADMVAVSTWPSVLVDAIDTEENVMKLYGDTLAGKVASNLSLDGIDVLQALLRWRRDAAEHHSRKAAASAKEFNPLIDDASFLRESSPPPEGVVALEDSPVARVTLRLLDQLMARLMADSPDPDVAARGAFGSYRLKLLQFFVAMFQRSSNLPQIAAKLVELNFVASCMELTFTYKWNTFVHQSFEQVVRSVVQSDDEELLAVLVTKTDLLDRIMGAFGKDAPSAGYLGQLIIISNLLSMENGRSAALVNAHPEWRKFMEEKIDPLNRLHVAQLGTLSLTGEFAELAGGAEALPEAIEVETTSMLENDEGFQYQPPMEPSWM